MPNDTETPGALDALAQTPTSRRAFLRAASLTAVGAGALAACNKTSAQKPAATTAAGATGATGGTMGAHD
ncbi:MAG TPA: hypothetical protein VFN38_10185, partial [Gemmatimonadaceae bacterium]|nr:hypothetical protein [Gemmatimonadaceae bacterium]